MKAYLNLEFDNRGELNAFMKSLLGPQTAVAFAPQPIRGDIRPHGTVAGDIVDAEIVGGPITGTILTDVQPQQGEQQKPPRKPRSDAGQPRGPYKTSDKPAEGASAPQAPTPAASVAAPAPTITSPTAPTPPGAAPTVVEARAALKRIHDTKGLGPEACIKHIQEFGVQAISKLPESMFAEFIRKADEKVAAAAPKK